MEKQRVLIAGCGLIGNAVGIQLYQQGFDVFGIRRNTQQIATCISPISIDLNLPSKQWENLPEVETILISLTPNARTPEGYTQCYLTNIQKLVAYYSKKDVSFYFLSSTAIYGDNQGEVNAKSPIKPNQWNGEILCKAEQFLLANTSASIINSAGIYGVLRWWLLDYVSAKKTSHINWNKISNRIHQEDLVNFIVQLIRKNNNKTKRYILCDDHSCPYSEIIEWLEQVKFPVHPTIKNTLDTDIKNNVKIGKLCRNNIHQLSGFELKYPTYKEGLSEQIEFWLAWQKLTNFQQAALYQVWQIPWGKTQSYRQIAHAINSKAYRAIGQTLKNNPCAPWIPCHRVISNDGSIGGFMGAKTGDAINRKRQLLAQENIHL